MGEEIAPARIVEVLRAVLALIEPPERWTDAWLAVDDDKRLVGAHARTAVAWGLCGALLKATGATEAETDPLEWAVWRELDRDAPRDRIPEQVRPHQAVVDLVRTTLARLLEQIGKREE